MIFPAVFLLASMVVSISGQFSTDINLLIGVADKLISTVGKVNSFNGPKSVSQARTSPGSNKLATAVNVRYYNNYAQASYCSDQLKNLTCPPCAAFKADINANNGVAGKRNSNFSVSNELLSPNELVYSHKK